MTRAFRPTTPIRNKARTSRKIGDYEIVAPVARGGIADVYLGEHVTTHQRVALKILDPVHRNHEEIGDRLLAEHEIMKRVRHPGLVDVHGADRNPGGLPYIVMEYLDGENLGELAERGLLELPAVLAIAAQIASAVAALHGAGVMHCDLKPDNVFVLYEPGPGGWPRIKVLDFGVARTLDDPPEEEGIIAGTPPYMAPEQWHGRPQLRSDIYGFGCLLYELCTGDVPFSGTLPELLTLHGEAIPTRPATRRAGIPAALDRLIMRMLAKDPAMRPAITDVHAELSGIAFELERRVFEAAS